MSGGKRRRPSPDDVDRFLVTQGEPHAPARKRRRHPKGMEPGVRLDPRTGEGEAVVAVAPGQDPAWADLLRQFGFAGVLDILDVVEVRAWEVWAEGQMRTLHYIRARVQRRVSDAVAKDIRSLCRELRKRRLRGPLRATLGDRALVVALADWQTGKDTESLVGRLSRLKALVPDRLERLRILGEPIKRLVVVGMGDLVEQCSGHYPMQAFSVDLDRREQVTLVRRALIEMLAAWVPRVPEMVVACVPGNHGENRQDGKAFTTFGDNDDVAVVEQVADVCAASDALKGISFVVPRNELTVTLDVFGTIVAFAHGHQARRGSGPSHRVRAWWKDMAHARHPVGDADILVTGHYHHLQVVSDAGRTWMQCPALEGPGASQWWTEQTGARGHPGTLTFVVTNDGWSSLEVLR